MEVLYCCHNIVNSAANVLGDVICTQYLPRILNLSQAGNGVFHLVELVVVKVVKVVAVVAVVLFEVVVYRIRVHICVPTARNMIIR